MEGVVTKSTGTWYSVFSYEKNIEIQARLKGLFRIEGLRDTNPVAVGDSVVLEREEGDYVIAKIQNRKNYIIRQSPKHRALRHIIAANIDQAVLVASISKPRTSNGFIDRFLVTSEAYRVPSIIVLNKTDIYTEKDKKILSEWQKIYTAIGYQFILTSTYENTGIDILKESIRDKRTLFSGHSGVGKSSLLNALEPTLQLKTNDISEKHEKGMHTTTFSELFRIDSLHAEIIDTPGIKEFGIVEMENYELKDFFPEFIPYLNQCKYHNCLHRNEPECSLIQALHDGKIYPQRYRNYLEILDDVEELSKKWELKRKGK